MTAVRPTGFPTWCATGATNLAQPDGTHQNLGWGVGEAPPSSYFNFLQQQYYRWLQFFDGIAPSTNFGDGSDGVIALDGVTSFVSAGITGPSGFAYRTTRDLQAETLSVASGVRLQTNGYKVAARTSITFADKSSVISADGAPAIGATGGLAGRAGTIGAGAAGGKGGSVPQPGGSFAVALGGVGGAGGGAGGGSGGFGGTSIAPINTTRGEGQLAGFVFGATGVATGPAGFFIINGGGGGGGGAGGIGATGGGGGAGGDVLIVRTRRLNIQVAQNFSAKGGTATFPNGFDGGGGGGGGGYAKISCIELSLATGGATQISGAAVCPGGWAGLTGNSGGLGGFTGSVGTCDFSYLATV